MAKWRTLDEFDYGTGDILLLMKSDPKKKVWRRQQGEQPEGYKNFKVRDETVSYSSRRKEDHCLAETVWDITTDKELSKQLGAPAKRVEDEIQTWYMSRTSWSSVVAWMWKKDLIEDFLKDSQ